VWRIETQREIGEDLVLAELQAKFDAIFLSLGSAERRIWEFPVKSE